MVTQRFGEVGQQPPPAPRPIEQELLEQISKKLGTVAESLQTLISAVKVSTTLPLDPETLNRFLQGARRPGEEKTWFPCWRVSWTCTAVAVTTMPFTLPAGWVCTRRVAKIYATYYHPDISLEVLVDGNSVTYPFGLSLSGGIDLDFGEYLVKKDSIVINTTNNTATDSILSLEVGPSLLQEQYFHNFWEPLITKTYERLEGVL